MQLKLDWSAYEDAGFGDPYADIPKTGGEFAKAIAVCINSGQCMRPSNRGVMCPSFRVHNEPAFSPGGRVRLLKKFLNGHLSDDEQLLLETVMAACVACKGCKRECDSAIDLAAIKSEFLAQQPQRGRHARRAWLFANLPRLLRYPRLLAAAIRLRNQSPLLASLSQSLLGIAAERTLPVPQSTPKWVAYTPATGSAQQDVVLLIDPFTRYYAPDVVDAALAVLTAAGYGVHLLYDDHAAGRSYFSMGKIDQARTAARATLRVLQPHQQTGRPVIGLEPSVLLMLRDEWRQLGLEAFDDALLLEEFIAKESQQGRFSVQFRDASQSMPVLIHGHCYEKASGASRAMKKALKLIPGLRFEPIESSCCGGAGSFAYEEEHRGDSRRMAELSLIPALQADENATLLSNGYSCREQVAAISGRQGLHLAQILARHLI